MSMRTHVNPQTGRLESCHNGGACTYREHIVVNSPLAAAQWNTVNDIVRRGVAELRDPGFMPEPAREAFDTIRNGGTLTGIPSITVAAENEIMEREYYSKEELDELGNENELYRRNMKANDLANGKSPYRKRLDYYLDCERPTEDVVLTPSDWDLYEAMVSGYYRLMNGQSMRGGALPNIKVIWSNPDDLHQVFDEYKEAIWNVGMNPYKRPVKMDLSVFGVDTAIELPAQAAFMGFIDNSAIDLTRPFIIIDASEHPGQPLGPEFDKTDNLDDLPTYEEWVKSGD